MKRRYCLLTVWVFFLFQVNAFASIDEVLIEPETTMPVLNENSFYQISALPVTMPTIPASGVTGVNGKITINFTSGTLFTGQLNDLWARVNYDGKTEYWDLDPGMLASDGKSLSMQFESKFDSKNIQLEFYGFDTQGRQTSFTNPIQITVDSNPSSLTMPQLPITGSTDTNGKITINFISGTLLASQLNDLWARVTYGGKTEYWDLDPAMLATDGKSISMQFEPKFDGKTMRLEFYGFDKEGKQTGFSNPLQITIDSSPSGVTMPIIPATTTTDANGKSTISFTSGTLFASQLFDLWARVTYDGKTEYWDLDPGMLAADGQSLTMQFAPEFHGKVLTIEFYGFDTTGKQTGFTTPIQIIVDSLPSTVVMPGIPITATTELNGKVNINFTSGTLFANQFNDLWGRVKYDDKTEYWDLDPRMLATDGKSMSMQFESKFDGKTIGLEFYGFDREGKQTGFTNPISIIVNSSPSAVIMPTFPSSVTSDTNGRITINFTSGTLFASQLSDLWARVSYDNKTEYWNLDPRILALNGNSLTMQFESKFYGKILKFEFYGFDQEGKQTDFTNPIQIILP